MQTNPGSPEDDILAEQLEFIRVLEGGDAKPGQRSVLVVDDEPSVRRMVSRSMTSLDKDLKVYQAENGKEALDVLKAIRVKDGADPAMIVTDLQMPIMDGWDFIDQLWNECQSQGRKFGVPVIVLSSSSGVRGTFFGKSVHGEKCKYRPLVAIAKEECIKPFKYDSKGEKGLAAWIKYFLRHPDTISEWS